MDFKAMRRKDLQKLCKKYGLRANSKTSQMAKSLASLLLIPVNNKNIEVCLNTFGVSSVCEGGMVQGRPKKVSYVLHEEKDECHAVSKRPDAKSPPNCRRSSRRVSKFCEHHIINEKTQQVRCHKNLEFSVSIRSAKLDAFSSSVVCSVIKHKNAKKGRETCHQNAELDLSACKYEGMTVEAGNEILSVMPPTRTLRNRCVVTSAVEVKRRRSKSYPMKAKDEEMASFLTAVSHTETLVDSDSLCRRVNNDAASSSFNKIEREVNETQDEQGNDDDETEQPTRRQQRHNLSMKDELCTTGNLLALLHRRTESKRPRKRIKTRKEEHCSVNYQTIHETDEDKVKELIGIFSTDCGDVEGLKRREDEHEVIDNHAKDVEDKGSLLSSSVPVGEVNDSIAEGKFKCDQGKCTGEPQAIGEAKEKLTKNFNDSKQHKLEGIGLLELEERFDNIMKKLIYLHKMLRGETSSFKIVKQANFNYPVAQLALAELCDSKSKADGLYGVTPIKHTGHGLSIASDSIEKISHKLRSICTSNAKKTTKSNLASAEKNSIGIAGFYASADRVRDKENLQKTKANFLCSRSRLQNITNQVLD